MKKIIIVLSLYIFCTAVDVQAAGYAVLTGKSTASDKQWGKIVDALVEKYPDAKLYTYAETPFEVLEKLKVDKPHYMALVLPPNLIDRQTVAGMHRLSRKLDDDPYGDSLWGIITGYSAEDAMRIVRTKKPRKIKSGFGTTGFKTESMVNVLNISDSKRGEVLVIEDRGKPKKFMYDSTSAAGLTHLLEKFWREKEPGLFVTSGHATQYNLEMSWGQGLITCYSNRFYALRRDQINGFASFLSGVMCNRSEQDVADYVKKCKAPALALSTAPKVWIGAGNCLLGDIRKSRNTMAVTALSAGGFNQLVGYTVTTWFGRMGWGTLGMFNNAQHMTLAEAFFMSNQSLLEESERQYPGLLKMNINPDDDFFKIIYTSTFAAQGNTAGIKKFEKESLGLLHDRDCVAFYGDPRWEARMPGAPAITITPNPTKGGIELKIETTPKFKAGSGFTVLFSTPIKNPDISGGDGWDILLTDDFMLVKSSDIKPNTIRKIQIISESKK